jgi:hypothetical protein
MIKRLEVTVALGPTRHSKATWWCAPANHQAKAPFHRWRAALEHFLVISYR